MRRRVLTALGAALLAGALAPVAARAEALPAPPAVHHDATAEGSGPLDLTTVSFGQAGTLLELSLASAGSWNQNQLGPAEKGHRSLCVVLSYGAQAAPRARVCVAGNGGRTELVKTALLPDGSAVPKPVTLPAEVGRTDESSVLATISPFDLGLPYGAFSWHVESAWSGGRDCSGPAGCVDRFPAQGDVPAHASLLAVPSCFGAAARDPDHPCSSPSLARRVIPTPQDALITPNAPCDQRHSVGLIVRCDFGAAAAPGRPVLALMGDSHAVHWRGAMEVALQAEHWHGTTISRSGCPFSESTAILPSYKNQRCKDWNPQARAWLRAHKEVRAVALSAHVAVRFVSDPVGGYVRLFRDIPASVKEIYVLRDTPTIPQPPSNCLPHAIASHLSIGFRCAQPRATDLKPDPMAQAANRTGDRRVRLIDLTRYMCTPNVCPPVVGGVLVHKDGDHLTRLFSTTLGPYLLRAMRPTLR